MPSCSQCGKQVGTDAFFCPNCGTRIPAIILIDGTNVAFGAGQGSPLFTNILLAYNYYKDKGHTDIHVICDASLRHMIDIGVNQFDEALRRYKWLRQATKGKQADALLLKLASDIPNSIIVSNDGFDKEENLSIWPEIKTNRHRLQKYYIDNISGQDRFFEY